jgi:serine/threonine-protein kinase
MTPQESQWLERLLTLNASDRQRELEALGASQPALQTRVLELLRHVAVTTQVFMRPILGALNDIVERAKVVHQAGDSVAGYRLLRQLGHGGMSTVWLAERLDGVIKRAVALKLPLYMLTAPEDIARFAREKDVLGALTHPHIARLYDAGVTDAGQPFIVLEFVDGVPITAYCDERRLGIRERLQLFLQALSAVADAHRHLIVHLDIKPSNILVDADGQVKLLDFGISKLLTEPAARRNLELEVSTEATPPLAQARATSIAMTALYAAPEQVLGMPLSTSSDIYALGVLLHELLTGGSPYAGIGDVTPLAKILELITTGSITRPSSSLLNDAAANLRGMRDARRLRARLSGDLDAIVQLAMRQEPAERYRSVEALADDLSRLLADRPVDARARAWAHSAHLFLKRHLAASIAASVGIVLSAVAANTAVAQYQEARASEARAVSMLEFMFGMASNAEPNESQPDTEVTGKQMIAAAVQSARSQFAGQPQLQGELLAELGRMYSLLDENVLARQTLVESLTLLESQQQPHDPALNRARALLASLLFFGGEVASARALASQVLEACTHDDIPCAKARPSAWLVMTHIHRLEGSTEKSLEAVQHLVADTTRGYGDQSAEMASALGSMALALRNTGRLVDAGETIRKALAIAATRKVRRNTRSELARNAAAIDFDLGRYPQARQQLQELLAQSKEAIEAVIYTRLLANVHLAEGHPLEALAATDQAIVHGNGLEADPQLWFARQARAMSLALLAKPDEALQEIGAVIAGLAASGYQPLSFEVLRARRVRAEILARADRFQDAHVELQTLLKTLTTLPEPLVLELGQALDLMGCIEQRLDQQAAAKDFHVRAAAELEKILPRDHPFLTRNTLYRLAAAHDQSGFRRLATEIELAPQSIWRELLDAQLDPGQCKRSTAACTFVLW